MEQVFSTTTLQNRMRYWVETRLGAGAMAPEERATRFLEEAIELAQAMGVKKERAERLLEIVYLKDTGAAAQELGGAGITLAACAESMGYALSHQMLCELERVEALPAKKFQDRQAWNVENGIGDASVSYVHGRTCPKVFHSSRIAYLHDAVYDGPYDVDGVDYCGRCHMAL